MKTDKGFTLNTVLMEDLKIGGFTVYFKEFPDVIAEGDNEDQAIKNLLDALRIVLKHKSEQDKEWLENRREKAVNFRPIQLSA